MHDAALALVLALSDSPVKTDFLERLEAIQRIIDMACAAQSETTVTIQNIPLVAPVVGQYPLLSIETDQYTGTVTWDPSHSPFQSGTVYKAVIVLTAKPGYTFEGVPYGWFRVAGTPIVINEANSGVVYVTFGPTNLR